MNPTIHQTAVAIRSKKITPTDVLQKCLANIDRYESMVQAWVLVDRDRAMTDAERLTIEANRGNWRGPLHGIPIGIKDIMDVFDLPTACGSKRWANSIARRDATIVRRLREAGAVIVGKTVTTQYASFDPPKTRNPWKQDRTPGGSSSGSAAAVACGMCVAALGSQTGGSITRPASYCGIAGVKPTYGRVSCDGIMPLAHSMDHPGPMANDVRDLAIMLDIIAGPDVRDPICADRPAPNCSAAVRQELSQPRIGRIRGLFEDLADDSVKRMIDDAGKCLKKCGASVIELALPGEFSSVIDRHRKVMAVEAAMFHRERLERHPDDYAPNISQLLQEGLSCPAPEYARCKEHQESLTRETIALFDGVDVLLCPATTDPAPSAATTGNPAFNSPWSYTGFATISLPADWSDDGLPLAIQLVGPPWREEQLFRAAVWCERAIAFAHRSIPNAG